jgi:ribosomal protein S18 acetylase RimI-like enzyme
MDFTIQTNTRNIKWQEVSQTLKSVGMAWHEAAKEKIIFRNSQAVVFIFDRTKMVGFGRTISDGICQAAIYDVAVQPEYQGMGIGKLIIQNLTQQLPGCSFILYASPGKEDFYRKINFRKMKTGMALFIDAENKRERGFTE